MRLLISAVALLSLTLAGFARPAVAQIPNNSEIPGSVLVFPLFIRGSVNVGTALAPVLAPRSAFEISVTCPDNGLGCGTGQRVRLLAHWVCPGRQNLGPNGFVCRVTDFPLETTVKGTIWFNPDNLASATAPTATGGIVPPVPFIPAPECEQGYLIVWVIDPEDGSRPAIAFNALIGNAVIRNANGAASAYNAVPIQAIGPQIESNPNPPPDLRPRLLDDPFSTDRRLVFDGLTEYARVAGRVVGTVRYERAFVRGVGGAPNTSRIDTFLTFLTLDVLANRPNLPTFVDLDFFNEVEVGTSTSHEFVCWSRVRLSAPLPNGINESLREPFGRKGLFESEQAFKVSILDIDDESGPVTLLGLIETQERGPGGGGAGIVREYSYTMFSRGEGVPTEFVP